MIEPYEKMAVLVWEKNPAYIKNVPTYSKVYFPEAVKGFKKGEVVIFGFKSMIRRARRRGYTDRTKEYIEFYNKNKLSETQKGVLSLLSSGSKPKSDIISELGLTESKFRTASKGLIEKGYINKKGFGKTTVYEKV
tara:strand:- start:36082 stop:36489 length:408 start_codon:yes stop_codon:yes gene_type:complete